MPAILVLATAAMVMACRAGKAAGQINLGSPASYPEQTVTYVEYGHFYLVHGNGGSFLALFERSPWLQRQQGASPGECQIRWYLGPRDVTTVSGDTTTVDSYPATHPGSGDRDPIGDGFFRENCTGWIFDAEGRRLLGASESLDRFDVTVIDGSLVVDTTKRFPSKPVSSTAVP